MSEEYKTPETEVEIPQRYLDLIKKNSFDPQESDYFLGLVHEMMELTGGREPKVVCSESDVELSEKCVAKMNELIVFIERRKIGQPGGVLRRKHNRGPDISVGIGNDFDENLKVKVNTNLRDRSKQVFHKTIGFVSDAYDEIKTFKYKNHTILIGENNVLGSVLLESYASGEVSFDDSPEGFENIRFDEELDLVIISVGSEDFVFDPLTGKKLSSGYHKIFKRDNKIYGILGAKEEEINPYGEQGLIDIVGDRLDEKFRIGLKGVNKQYIFDTDGRVVSKTYHELKKFRHKSTTILIGKEGSNLSILKEPKGSAGFFEETSSPFNNIHFNKVLGHVIISRGAKEYIVDLHTGEDISGGHEVIHKRDGKLYGMNDGREEEIILA